jgi:hypothetical protein
MDFIVLSAVEEKISLHFSENDSEIYQNYKTAFLPTYSICRAKYAHRFAKPVLSEN